MCGKGSRADLQYARGGGGGGTNGQVYCTVEKYGSTQRSCGRTLGYSLFQVNGAPELPVV